MDARTQTLPPIPLLTSVIFSSIIVGIALPQARTLPLSVIPTMLTVIYHSGLLVSNLMNHDREEKATFYIDPVECPHILWTFCLAAFWLMSSSGKLKVLIEGPSQDTDYILAFLCLVQWLLNAYFSVHSLLGLRDRFARQVDLEAGRTSDTISRFVPWKSLCLISQWSFGIEKYSIFRFCTLSLASKRTRCAW